MKQAKQVAEWHHKFGVPISEYPKTLQLDRVELRNNILVEEVKELYRATKEQDIDGIADALADCLFVLLGTACECGLHTYMEKIFDEVHRSNMSKLDENGNPIFRKDGKVLKSKLFTPPNFKHKFPHPKYETNEQQ
jgi:predicted HAD superfamily Cof-like phosphohydrolase